MRDAWIRKRDENRFMKILDMQSDNVKVFYDLDGCGLEIEFGVIYERRCRSYIETGLRKMKERVGKLGKFVPDMSIGNDFNVEIVLKPMLKDQLQPLFFDIKRIIDFYENFRFDENCGVHANFRADEKLKRSFYGILVNGGYQPSRFIHSKYKKNFCEIVNSGEEPMTYEEYVAYQNRISAKYAGVNFLKDKLIEFRTLKLNWDDISYVYDLYERAKQTGNEHAVIELFPYQVASQYGT
jgi:hypothetical protein